MRLRIILSSTGAAILSTLLFAGTQRSEQPAASAPGVRPQPVSESIRRGLDWLVRTQHENGGWSQGEESAGMRSSMIYLRDKPNVADTCMATLALMRAGSTPSQGEHARAIRRALDFLSAELENSDPMSLYVTSVRDTRVQSKLGPYIDTFLTALVLAESKGKMPDESGNKRIAASLNKVIDKIERNQQADGTWDKRGWAPVLSQSMAAKALNRAAQAGVPVSEEIRAKAELYARRQFDGKTGRFTEAGSAGVPLYSTAASLGAMQDSENTNLEREREILKQLHDARTEQERQSAQRALAGIAGNRKDLVDARIVVAKKIGDQRFVQGFGSNGGEEFLSYMSIGESLVTQGGEEWEKWNTHITQNLSRIQNQDGSWTGHHCITGRNFCTAAALLVLTVDRTAAPLAGRIQSRSTANR
jgi:Prenyltransferase and squalene oxidase repeat